MKVIRKGPGLERSRSREGAGYDMYNETIAESDD